MENVLTCPCTTPGCHDGSPEADVAPCDACWSEHAVTPEETEFKWENHVDWDGEWLRPNGCRGDCAMRCCN